MRRRSYFSRDRTMMRNLYTLLILLLFVTAASGQISAALENQTGYISNAFSNHAALPDWYTALDGALNQDWTGERGGLRLHYDGSATLFRQYSERNHHSHEAGLAAYLLMGESEHRLDAGLQAGGRFHSESYQWYEQEQLQAYASLKFIAAPQWYTYAGVSWNLRRYPELTPFSHQRTQLYGRSSWFLPTGTTLIAEADLLFKSYTSAENEAQAAYSDVATSGEGNSSQLLMLVRAAQALSAKSGLSLEYQLRHNLASSTRYLAGADSLYYSDEELFEDFFAWHGTAVQMSLRQELPWGMRLTLSARRELRSFDDRPAADLLGEPFADGRLREDRRSTLAIDFEKKVRLDEEGSALLIALNGAWLQNASNDLYYDYRNSWWSLGFSWDF
ncbi:MAG TPA: hypothetical protein PKY55_06790 [bacterium]|nr:hypothetical protein [bacterium]HPM59092.1 hypothetical protein [bacterium]